MSKLRFEMIRRPQGHYGWRLVETRDGAPRVVARGEQEYVARGGARRALTRVSREMPGASIVDRTRRAPRPTAHFEFVPTFPLLAGRSAETRPEGGKRSGPRRDRADGKGKDGDRRRDAASAQAATATRYRPPPGRGLLQELGAHTAGSILAGLVVAGWGARRKRKAKRAAGGAEAPPADRG